MIAIDTDTWTVLAIHSLNQPAVIVHDAAETGLDTSGNNHLLNYAHLSYHPHF